MSPKLAESAIETAGRIARGDLNCEDRMAATFEKIRRLDGKIHAFLATGEAEAMERAREIDKRRSRGEKLGRLAGVGVAVKDNICVTGMPATCASKMLRDFRPPYDATVIQRIKMEGGIILGKVNMDEFAMGNTTVTSYFGPTLNPWDLERVPGGSSGGSAAAVASGMVAVALGSDTGGSVRCPASFCSVVGLKPTYGAVSRYGLIPYANSLEQIGPLAGDAADAALLYDVISGSDPLDETSSRGAGARDDAKKEMVAGGRKRTGKQKDGGTLKGLRIGSVKELFGEGTQDKVSRAVHDGTARLEALGGELGETRLEALDYALAAYYIVAMAEASSNLSRYDGVRYGGSMESKEEARRSVSANWNEVYAKVRTASFGPEVKRRILLGTFVLSEGYYQAYYVRAQAARTRLRRDFERAFKTYDVLVGPTMPVVPPKIGEKTSPLEDYMMDVNTVPANLVGIPSISIPCGLADGLPVGMQLMAPEFGERLLFEVAEVFAESMGAGASFTARGAE